MTTNTIHSTPTQKHLHRSDDRILGGVCSGIAEYTGLDTTLVRIIAVVTTLFGGGGIVLYAVAWLVMPDARGTVLAARKPSQAPTAPAQTTPPQTAPAQPATAENGTSTLSEPAAPSQPAAAAE